MNPANAKPLVVVLGDQIRALREASQVRQEQVAATARRWGLRWTRATVAAIEAGRRRVSLEEFLLLPFVLSWSHCYPPPPLDRDAKFIGPADTLPSEGWVALTPETEMRASALHAMLSGRIDEVDFGELETPELRRVRARFSGMRETMSRKWGEIEAIWWHVWPKAKIDVKLLAAAQNEEAGDAEQKGAGTLGAPPLAVALAARKLWGRSLTEERDRRVSEQAPADIRPRTLQAIRGHVTRGLLAELQPIVAGLRARSPAMGLGEKAKRKRTRPHERLRRPPTGAASEHSRQGL